MHDWLGKNRVLTQSENIDNKGGWGRRERPGERGVEIEQDFPIYYVNVGRPN